MKQLFGLILFSLILMHDPGYCRPTNYYIPVMIDLNEVPAPKPAFNYHRNELLDKVKNTTIYTLVIM